MHRLALIVLTTLACLGIAACEDGPYDAPPPGQFACGADNYCDVLTQYCQNETATSTTGEQGYSCQNIPTTCNGTLTCSCVSSCSGASCAQAGDGSITVTCK